MPCLCLHGDGPPECVLLYTLTVVQLASPAIDFHTISLEIASLWSSPPLQTELVSTPAESSCVLSSMFRFFSLRV